MPAHPDRLAPLEIRSFRSVFELERRIYRVDRLRLNPQGIPVRGVVYALALVCAAALVQRLPVLGWPLVALPWIGRDVVLPLACAALLAVIRIDGRPFHHAGRAVVRLALTARHRTALRPAASPGHSWWPPSVVLLPDGSDPRVRRMSFTGPGVVAVALAHRLTTRPRRPTALRRLLGADIEVQAHSTAAPAHTATVIEVAPRARLRTRTSAR